MRTIKTNETTMTLTSFFGPETVFGSAIRLRIPPNLIWRVLVVSPAPCPVSFFHPSKRVFQKHRKHSLRSDLATRNHGSKSHFGVAYRYFLSSLCNCFCSGAYLGLGVLTASCQCCILDFQFSSPLLGAVRSLGELPWYSTLRHGGLWIHFWRFLVTM